MIKHIIITLFMILLINAREANLPCEDPNCINCNQTHPNICFKCINNSYYIQKNACQFCSDRIEECLTCQWVNLTLTCNSCNDDKVLNNDSSECMHDNKIVIILTAAVAFLLLLGAGVAIVKCSRRGSKTPLDQDQYQRV